LLQFAGEQSGSRAVAAAHGADGTRLRGG